MKESFVRTLTKGLLLVVLSLMALNLAVIQVSFGQATQLKVVAPTTDIPVPTKFSVDITVVDIPAPPHALFTWQIKLYYNPSVLYFLNVTLPSGHVFDGKLFFTGGPFNGSDAGGTYILFSNSLTSLDYPSTVTGDGALCQIYFQAKTNGTSVLVFSRPLGGDGDTWLLWSDFYGDSIDFTVVERPVDNPVKVVGFDIRQPSSISINLDRSLIVTGDEVTISGAISGALNVTVADGTAVYVEYWDYSTSQWKVLAMAYTLGGQYSYTWSTRKEDQGLWTLRARWEGDDHYKASQSDPRSVEVAFPRTWIKIEPNSTIVGNQTYPVFLPTTPFSLDVIVQDVIDLFEWQIKFYFNSTIFRAVDVWLPSDNVLGENHTALGFAINNTAGFVQASTRSSAGGVNVTGTGILCQVDFIAVSAPEKKGLYKQGSSDLVFDSNATMLRDSVGRRIFYMFNDPASAITVYAQLKPLSTITLFISSPTNVGSNVTISGQVKTLFGGGIQSNVTITSRPSVGRVIVPTDNQGKYSYVWVPDQNGTYKFQASWDGNDDYEGALSDERTVSVEEEGAVIVGGAGPDIMLYLLIATIAVIAVLAVAVVYLKRFRKAPPPLPI